MTLTPTEWLIGIGGFVALIAVVGGFWWLTSVENRIERAQPWAYWTTFAILAFINYQVFAKTGSRPVSLFWLFTVAAIFTFIIPHAIGWLWKMISGR